MERAIGADCSRSASSGRGWYDVVDDDDDEVEDGDDDELIDELLMVPYTGNDSRTSGAGAAEPSTATCAGMTTAWLLLLLTAAG